MRLKKSDKVGLSKGDKRGVRKGDKYAWTMKANRSWKRWDKVDLGKGLNHGDNRKRAHYHKQPKSTARLPYRSKKVIEHILTNIQNLQLDNLT